MSGILSYADIHLEELQWEGNPAPPGMLQLFLRGTGSDPGRMPLSVTAIVSPVPRCHYRVGVRFDEPAVVAFQRVNRRRDRCAAGDKLPFEKRGDEPGPVGRRDAIRNF